MRASAGTVGVGMPGTISPATGLVKNANSTWLNGRPLHPDLERALDRPVRLANDANCFALSEATDGAAAGAGVVFGVILGTGTGGGVVVDGRVAVGANAIGGGVGTQRAAVARCRTSGRDRRATADAAAASRRSSAAAACSAAYGGSGAPTARADRRGRRERATRARAAAVETLHAARLAKALATVINLLDPDVVVLGGGLSNIESLYARVPRFWSDWVFSDRVDTRLARARHGDSSGVRGAAWLWPG